MSFDYGKAPLTLHEDALPKDYPRDEMFPYSQVLTGNRMFPDIYREFIEPPRHAEGKDLEKVILETNALVEHVRVAGGGKADRPRPEWVRGKCPECGDDLVSNCYYVGGRGYLICWECWSSLSGTPTCTYRHVL